MNVGFVGLGKLGLPVATAMASRGLTVYGYDIKPPDIEGAKDHEEGFLEVYEQGKHRLLICSDLKDVVANADTIFVAVQTPHEKRFEGVRPLPEARADFDYSYLVQAVDGISGHAAYLRKHITLSVISTVLPGTMAREVEPRLSEYVSLAYNPSFIAMGSTIRDFSNPEFVLLGGDDDCAVQTVYESIGVASVLPLARLGEGVPPPIYKTSIPNAELIKVSYNTFIGLKLAFANTVMEVCHKTDCDVDEVMGALKLAHRRLISGAYLDGGMGDGGGCHPRDNIALSWLARELDLSHDLFEDAMLAREDQTAWLVELVHRKCQETGLPPAMLGVAYKPGSHITTGSPALLAWSMLMNHPARYLHEGVERVDPYVTDANPRPSEPKVYLVGCRHPEFGEVDYRIPKGSVVIDPWRFIPDQAGVEVVRVGEASGGRHRLPRTDSDPEPVGREAARVG
jgi:UDPglucose 6-dehydrogenase